MPKYLDLEQLDSAPSAPPAGRTRVYALADGLVHVVDQDDGDQTPPVAESSTTYGGSDSFQPVAVDLELAAAAGAGAGDSAFLAPIMGNVLGDALTRVANYIGGLIGALSVTGTKASKLQVGAVLGVVMDGVTEADGAVVAVIDGGDPSSTTRATAAFAARMNNNDAGSGVDYGLDLYDAGRSSDIMSSALPLAIAKAEIRMTHQVCVMQKAGAPVDGTTGDNFAAKGSLLIDTTNGILYINTGAIDSPAWTKVGTQS